MPQLKSGAAKLNELINLKNTIAQRALHFHTAVVRKTCIFTTNPKVSISYSIQPGWQKYS